MTVLDHVLVCPFGLPSWAVKCCSSKQYARGSQTVLEQVCAPLFVAGLRFFAVLSAVEGRGFGEQWCTLKGDGVGGGGAHVFVFVCLCVHVCVCGLGLLEGHLVVIPPLR